MDEAVRRDNGEQVKRKGGATRYTILLALEEILLHVRWRRVTTVMLAQAARVAPGTIYQYWEDLDDVLAALVQLRRAHPEDMSAHLRVLTMLVDVEETLGWEFPGAPGDGDGPSRPGRPPSPAVEP